MKSERVGWQVRLYKKRLYDNNQTKNLKGGMGMPNTEPWRRKAIKIYDKLWGVQVNCKRQKKYI
jgi:hypothetical protein